MEPGAAEPGNFKWTVIDNAAGEAPTSAAADKGTIDKSAPARAAIAQIRAETARVLDEARKKSSKVSRIAYDLRVRCVVQQVEGDDVAAVAHHVGLPQIANAAEAQAGSDGTLELCEVDYSQRVRSSSPQAKAETGSVPVGEPVDYKVAFPVD